METTAYALIAIFCLLFIAAIALLSYREKYAKVNERYTDLEARLKATDIRMCNLAAENNALREKYDGRIKVLSSNNPERREAESDAGYARRCRMSIGNKAAQHAEIGRHNTVLRIYINP